MAEWTIATVLKTVRLKGLGGSNPSPSARLRSLSYARHARLFFIEYALYIPSILAKPVRRSQVSLSELRPTRQASFFELRPTRQAKLLARP